jgi:flagellar hook-basal body complex protein FliE
MSPLGPISASPLGLMPRVSLAPPASPLAPAETSGAQPLAPAQPNGDSFATLLDRMVSDVNSQQKLASQSVSALQGGQNVPLHQTVIAMEEANVSFQLMVEVRNRLMDAYQEIMRMQI